MPRFDRDLEAPQFSFKEATRETPEFLGQTIVIVPLSIGVGFAVLCGGLLICWGFHIPADGALVAGGIATGACALVAFWRVFADQIYMGIETITGHDWNQDGFIGPPPENRIVTIEVTNPDTNNIQYLNLPEHLYEKLPLIAHLLSIGKPFSEGAMTGSGRPLARSEFHQLRDIMFARGLAQWRNEEYPTQGIELTAYGKSVMRRVREDRTAYARIPAQGSPKVLSAGTEGEWDA